MKLLQRQEVEVFYIIPSLRKYLAVEMKHLGKKQKEIAKLLGIEEAAVSQYIKGKRGSKIEFSRDIKKEIKLSAKKIKDDLSLMGEIQRLLRSVMSTGEICRIHKSLAGISQKCEPGLINCFEVRR